jgi:hypothetical protein
MTCTCGSKLYPQWQYDARGIELCKTCPKCHDERMSGYRPDVLTDNQYWADEPIEEDD